MSGFINDLTPEIVSAQISEDMAAIFAQAKNLLSGELNTDAVKTHIGRIAGTKLIGANLDCDCDENEAFGGSDPEYAQDILATAEKLGIENPVGSSEEAVGGVIINRILWRIAIEVARKAGLDERIIDLLRSMVG